jgi:phage terminase large subunit GpA-like protein
VSGGTLDRDVKLYSKGGHYASPFDADPLADEDLRAMHARTVRLPPDVDVATWSEQYRKLTRVSSALPGPWKNRRVPHAVEIMRCLTDHKTRHVVFMAASQVCKTEIGINWFGRNIMCDPAPMLWITGTENSMKKTSKNRFDPMLDQDCFEQIVPKKRGHDSARTVSSIQFENGVLNFGSANSPSALASDPIRDVTFDEVDRYKLSSQDEGDALQLGLARQSTFEEYGAKTFYISSPDIDGESRIQQLFDSGDRRRYFVRCHACNHPQILIWEQVKFPDGPETAHYECEHCHTRWDDAQRWAACRGGEWVAETTFERTASFHLSALYSSFVRLRPVVERWLSAQGKPDQLQGVFNTLLGVTWAHGAERLSAAGIPREDWNFDFPSAVVLLVGFADVQGDRIEVSVFGVSTDESLFPVTHEIFIGNTEKDEVWASLEDFRLRTFTREDGHVMPIAAIGVDCGFRFDRVCDWVRSRSGRVYAIKGMSRGISEPMVAERKASKSVSGRRFYKINADSTKYNFMQKVNLEDGPGRVHYPDRECFGAEYFKQLEAEKLQRRTRNGYLKYEWVLEQGRRNEALDCAAGIMGVLRWLNPQLQILAKQNPILETRPAKNADGLPGLPVVKPERAPQPVPTPAAEPKVQEPAAPKKDPNAPPSYLQKKTTKGGGTDWIDG